MVDIASDRNSVAERLDRQEQLDFLRRAIEDLPDDTRPAFVAAVIDGYTYREVAEMLSIPVGTVAHRIYRARRSLRNAMPESFMEA